MNNLMDTYLKFTEKKIKKYLKAIFSSYYNEEFVSEYLKTYINARYYNVQNTEKPARAFYLRILDELNFKEDTLMKRCEEEAQTLDEKQNKLNLIHCINEVFGYILFFDNVRNIENFKTIDSLKEIIEKIAEICHYSPSHFMKFFKNHMGTSFIKYLNDFRLIKARTRILTTEESILEIAGDCGFNNLSHFNRQYKKKYGITPSMTRGV